MPNVSPGSVLLAVESSCDETAAAIVDAEYRVLSNVVASQDDLHQRFGGVVPEIASRAHVRRILPVIDEAMRLAKVDPHRLAAVAVCTEPGLVGSLLVGLTAAKTLALAWNVPLVAVNHIEAHLFACRMAAGPDVFPSLGLVVSGGHSNLYHCQSPLEYKLLGGTIDDAAGEAFDKVAAILGLPYPGGPAVERAARQGDPSAVKFPRPFLNDERLAFSFSGLKTAVLYAAKGTPGSNAPVPPLDEQRIADLAASFQQAAVDVLVGKCRQALEQFGLRQLCVGGGVAANGAFREALERMTQAEGIALHIAPREYCTDNAAMGAIGWELLKAGRTSPLDLDVTPGLVRKR